MSDAHEVLFFAIQHSAIEIGTQIAVITLEADTPTATFDQLAEFGAVCSNFMMKGLVKIDV